MLRSQEDGVPGVSARPVAPEWLDGADLEVYDSSGLPGASEWDR